MNPILEDVIDKARAARDGMIAGELEVKECNAIYNHNHTIVTAVAVDLRERMFAYESEAEIGRLQQREADPPQIRAAQ